MHRVAVTGAGILCALGLNRETCWTALANGTPGLRPMTKVDPAGMRFTLAGELPDYSAARYFEPKAADLLDPCAQYGAVAAREAVRHAGLCWTDELRERAAIVCGTSVGGQTTQDREFEAMYGQGRPRVHPLSIPRIMPNAATSQIALEHGILGPSFTTSTACSSANHAIGLAFQMVRCGQVPVALAGGTEAPFSLGFVRAWDAMRVVAPDTCRPFDAQRKGLILGEGAGMLVLERLVDAQARGANILAEIVGCGMSSDAHHITQPLAAGAARAIRAALADAQLDASAIGYINAHGTGTMANDSTESEAIHQVFGSHAAAVPVSATKSLHGHALGAAGAIEAVATVLALHHGVLPPTANLQQLDPKIALNVIANEPREQQVQAALSNSFAFGGLNAVLALRRVA